ncbi:MAG: MFS transporter [Hyphomicrobiaceae bacterium]
MLATVLARRLDRLGIHYGWVMLALTFVTLFCGSAVISLGGVLIDPVVTEFGWQRSDVSAAIGLLFFVFACMAPFAGALMLRYGVPRMAATSATLVVVGMTATTMVTERWHLLVTMGIVLGAAAGMGGAGLAATIASRWFVEKRGLAMGILTSAFAAGQLVFLPTAAWLSTTYGWRMAVLPVIVLNAICAILYVLVGRSWPADVDQPAYGETKIVATVPSADGAIALSLRALKDASQVPMFWLLAGTFFICGLSSNGMVQQHFIPFCADNNIGAVVAASYLALMGVCNFVGTIGSGWLSDRFDNRILLAVYYALRGVSLVWLPFSDFSVVALTIWAIFFGLDFIATVPPTVRLAGQAFGPKMAPVVFGWIFAAHQVGASVAAYGSGASRDILSTYLPAFIFAGTACFLAAALFVGSRAARPQQV